MPIYREKGHFGVVAARPGELKLNLEAMSLPRRAGAHLGELELTQASWFLHHETIWWPRRARG